MRKIRYFAAFALALALLLSLSGCASGGNSKYSVIKKLETQQFCLAFREGDESGNAVIAALAVLQSDGAVSRLAGDWFGTDTSKLEGNAEALEEYKKTLEDGQIQRREYIVGYDAGRLPISGTDETGNPTGFDVELAQAFCKLLGWTVKYVAIDASNAVVELGSGNVDCVMGGYAYDPEVKGIITSPVYMNNTVVVATLKGSGIHSVRGLSGKTLTVGNTGYFQSVLETYPEFSEKAKYVVTIPGDMDECFQALVDGSADAIITDLVSLDYYE